MNTNRTAPRRSSPTFRERMDRLEAIADRLADMAEVDDYGRTEAMMDDARFLRAEAVRMAEVLKRLKERDQERRRFPRKEARR